MIEITPNQCETVGGGNIFTDAAAVIRGIWEFGAAYVAGIGAVGATLSNYYGPDMTLEIIAAGDLGA